MGFLGCSSRRRLVGSNRETRSVVLGGETGSRSRPVEGMQSFWTTKASVGAAVIDEFLSVRPVNGEAHGLLVWAIRPIDLRS